MSFELEGAIFVTYEEGMAALDTMQRASDYIAAQFQITMTRAEAQAHFDARALLFNRRKALLDEMELEYFYGENANGNRNS